MIPVSEAKSGFQTCGRICRTLSVPCLKLFCNLSHLPLRESARLFPHQSWVIDSGQKCDCLIRRKRSVEVGKQHLVLPHGAEAGRHSRDIEVRSAVAQLNLDDKPVRTSCPNVSGQDLWRIARKRQVVRHRARRWPPSRLAMGRPVLSAMISYNAVSTPKAKPLSGPPRAPPAKQRRQLGKG